MVRKPSADPYSLILGRGTTGDKESFVEDRDLKDKQTWIVESPQGDIVDIHQWDENHQDWDSLLGQFVRSVSGLSPDEDQNVNQLVEVEGPSPSKDGREPQFGYDYQRQEIYVYKNGGWQFLGSVDSAEGVTRTHSLDPTKEQVNDPTESFSASETGSSGSVDSGDHSWAVTFVASWGETTLGMSYTETLTVSSGEVELTGIPTASESVVDERHIYRTKAGGDIYHYVDNLADNTSTTYIDTTADADLGSEAPSDNNTEAHSGTLPEDFVSFDAYEGHNHDGNNSREIAVGDHDLDSDTHLGELPWDDLKNIPDNFTPDSHIVDPTAGPHTGDFPWSKLKNVPALASDPHTNEAHEGDGFAPIPHNNNEHSEDYLTSAVERIRYGAGQLGDINKVERLQPPAPIDTDGQIVKAYALVDSAPSSDVSASIRIEDDPHGTYFDTVVTLGAGDTMEIDTSISGQDVYEDSVLTFSLDDSDSEGQNFGLYLIIETEIGS